MQAQGAKKDDGVESLCRYSCMYGFVQDLKVGRPSEIGTRKNKELLPIACTITCPMAHIVTPMFTTTKVSRISKGRIWVIIKRKIANSKGVPVAAVIFKYPNYARMLSRL